MKGKDRISAMLASPDMPHLGGTLASVLFLAWPAIVEQIMLTLVQYVDTAMVGSLGSSATAAVGLTSSTTWLFNGLFNAAAVGFSVQVAQHLGAGRQEEAKRVTWQALRFVGLFGVLLGAIAFVLSFFLPAMLGADPAIRPDASLYFRIMACAMPFTLGSNMFSAIIRCSGDTKTPMILNLMINVLNIVLNTLFIYQPRQVELFGVSFQVWGAGWGVGGAAFASALSTAIVACLFVLVIFRRKSPVQIGLKNRYSFDRHCLGTAWKLGLPVALERATMSIAQIVITAVITGIGTVAVAANHLAVTAESISYLPASGVAVAGTTLVGQAIGAGRKDLAQRFARMVSWMGVAIMTAGGAVLFFFAPQLIQIFSTDPEVIDLGSQVLRIVAFAEPLFGASIVASGALRGAGDSRGPFLISLATMWGVRITLSLLLAGQLGLLGVWLAMAAELCVRGIVFMVRLYRGKWLHIELFQNQKGKNS